MSELITSKLNVGGQYIVEADRVLKNVSLRGVPGTVLQVVQGSTTTPVSVSSTTYTDTTLTATITPSSASSKILVLVDQHVNLYRETDAAFAGIRLLRGSTIIHNPISDSAGPFDFGLRAYELPGVPPFINLYFRAQLTVLDSPNTTSATTYKTQGRAYETGNLGVIIFQSSEGTINGASRIILMEIAA